MNIGVISNRYAKALYQYAAEGQCEKQVYREMMTLADSYLQVPALRKALDNPLLSVAEKTDLLCNACGGKVSPQTKRFFMLVLTEHREKFMQFMAVAYIDLYRKKHNILIGRLITAIPVSKEIEDRMRAMIVKGTITSGNFASFVTALLMLYTPVKTMGDNYVEIKKAFLAIDRIFDIFSLKTEIADDSSAASLTGIRKEIRFENVSFAYKPGVWVLKDIDLTVPVGHTVAFVGNSGGGKSTIVSLLPRFYDPQKGRVSVDGKDIRNFTLSSLRDQMAVVFQDNFLFSGTIRDNILIGRPGATEADLKEAVKNAHLDSFIATLKDGLDTVLGERGITLSGGQRQRVAIARAFIKNAPVIVLDEATSALDNKSEAVVQKALDNLTKNKTVFVIAHRLSTVENADMIVVLNQGEIVEKGTHRDLLQIPGGAYASLYNAQFKHKNA